jgi:hypothetical protein
MCELCGEPFEHKPSRNRKYCSKGCKGRDSRTRVTKECDECGEEVEKEPNEIERSTNVYCSRKCNIESQINDEIECRHCGKNFKPDMYTRKYCSKLCSAKDRRNRNVVSCAYCSNTFERTKGYTERYNNMFCSAECRSSWMSENSLFAINNPNEKDGRYSGFGSNWIEWRSKIRERADGNCENCGKTSEKNGRKLSVHHIEPRSKFINDDERVVEDSNNWNNLTALCRSCHMKAEHGKIEVENNV